VFYRDEWEYSREARTALLLHKAVSFELDSDVQIAPITTGRVPAKEHLHPSPSEFSAIPAAMGEEDE